MIVFCSQIKNAKLNFSECKPKPFSSTQTLALKKSYQFHILLPRNLRVNPNLTCVSAYRAEPRWHSRARKESNKNLIHILQIFAGRDRVHAFPSLGSPARVLVLRSETRSASENLEMSRSSDKFQRSRRQLNPAKRRGCNMNSLILN